MQKRTTPVHAKGENNDVDVDVVAKSFCIFNSNTKKDYQKICFSSCSLGLKDGNGFTIQQ
jgi:hypothetical protein